MSSSADNSRNHASVARERVRQAFFTGLAITVPLLVTLLVISLVSGFVFGSMGPLVEVLRELFGADSAPPEIVLEIAAVTLVLLGIFLVGLGAESRPTNGRLEERFDRAMGNVPGVGSVYQTFNEMSEMVMDTDTESFKEVKLVEFPTRNSYAVAFVTSEAAQKIERLTGNNEMLTLYVPMSPNPVMGGHVIYVPEDRCIDVDMSVEEGIKSIMTSGVSVGDDAIEDANEGPYTQNPSVAQSAIRAESVGDTGPTTDGDET